MAEKGIKEKGWCLIMAWRKRQRENTMGVPSEKHPWCYDPDYSAETQTCFSQAVFPHDT